MTIYDDREKHALHMVTQGVAERPPEPIQINNVGWHAYQREFDMRQSPSELVEEQDYYRREKIDILADVFKGRNFAREYLLRITEVSLPSARIPRFSLSDSIARVSYVPLDACCNPQGPEQKLAVDMQGNVRSRSRFLTKLLNPKKGYIRHYRDERDKQLERFLSPPPSTRPESDLVLGR